MKTMTEKELREINPEDFEGVDIAWNNRESKYTGRVLFDYDQGLSVLNKENTDECIAGFHGPAYTGKTSNYTTQSLYHKELTAIFSMLKDKFYNVQTRRKLCGQNYQGPGKATCSFT